MKTRPSIAGISGIASIASIALGLLLGLLAPLGSGGVDLAWAQEAVEEPPPLLPPAVLAALAAEVSGTAAKRTVQDLTLLHRQRGSRGFGAAAERIRGRLQEAGLAAVEVISLPADGTIFYGTQRSRPAWDAELGELWELAPAAGTDPGKPESGANAWTDARRIASFEARPITLAEDSASGEVTADLVDIGAGTTEADYRGREVRGKLVLTSASPGAVYPLAVGKLGAAGIVSYAQNQKTAWWGEDETLVRWGHLATFPPPTTFAFMVSLQQARAWQARWGRGETVRLRASVRAGQHPGSYDIATAVLPGSDPLLRGEEIVFSCHLDHQRPGANDNASGCAAILEAGRALARLVRDGRIAPPRRTLRWIFPPEIEGTISLLAARPAFAARTQAVIHLDMVGGDPEITKAVFHVTRSPKSLPTFVNDVGEAFGRFVNNQSYAYAATGAAGFPLVDPEGGKRALQADISDYTEGSDHEVWTEGSYRVPAIYMNDWPDRTIHTHADAVGNLDATKLLRAAFLGAADGYYLANLDAAQLPALWQVIRRHALERTAAALARRDELLGGGGGRPRDAAAAENVLRYQALYERGVVDSLARFAPVPPALQAEAAAFLRQLAGLAGVGGASAVTASGPGAAIVYRRAAAPKGPLAGFGYEYLADQLTRRGLPRPQLGEQGGLWCTGNEVAYEALNLVDGRRTVGEIHADLAAICGPLPPAEVAEYLATLAQIAVLEPRAPGGAG